MRAVGAIALALLALGIYGVKADAAPLSMTFTEARANVGIQLSDEALFEAPDQAPLAAEIDPATGSISGGVLQVPDFSTFITEPINADVTVAFDIGLITGSFDQASGALTLSGEAGGTLTANGKECFVSTTPAVLTLSTAGSSGGASPRSGAPFAAGLNGEGAIAGQWTDMQATPVDPGEDTLFCEDVEERIGGPGGIWLDQDDIVAPTAPQLQGTDPASPSLSANPRILGTAEAGSTVRVYGNPTCAGTPVAIGSAAELASPGIAIGSPPALAAPGLGIAIAAGTTAVFSATATDAVGNISACSAPLSYTRLHVVPPKACVVPKLVGKKLKRAKAALRAANCRLGKIGKPKNLKGKRPLVVKSSTPKAGASPANGKVRLKLGPKSRRSPGN
ncbi:MAG TPA: hypothetical protein VGV69_09860 [Solirubrobacterales bacterium]|nr:hypothetical protein [Solirubrobacterales bacterium]